MKLQHLFLSLIVIAAACFPSCDKVDCPFEAGCDTDTSAVGIVFDDSAHAAAQSDMRVVLLEEYTGHTCPNCPQGSATAQSLLDAKGDSLVVVAVHAGSFAEPYTSGNKYTTDFRCEAGEDSNEFFDPLAYPMGMISRNGTAGLKPVPFSQWEGKIAEIDQSNPIASIDLKNYYSTADHVLRSHVEVNWLADGVVGENYKVQLYLLESGMIDWQTDGGDDLQNYEHNHVLRAGINGSWGTDIPTSAMGETHTFEFDYDLDTAWDADNMEVVAFVYASSDYVVYQVNHAHIKNHQ